MDIEKLQTELKAKTEVNCFLACQWRDLNTSQNLAEMTGLGKEVGTDAAICQIATEFIKIKKEDKLNKQVIRILNKKVEELKKEIDEYESVEQSLMKCVREGGGYDEMLPIHYRQESESDDE